MLINNACKPKNILAYKLTRRGSFFLKKVEGDEDSKICLLNVILFRKISRIKGFVHVLSDKMIMNFRNGIFKKDSNLCLIPMFRGSRSLFYEYKWNNKSEKN